MEDVAEFILDIPLGFAVGFVIGLTGVGGGAVVAPALYVILGMKYAEAVALSLIYSVFTKIFSMIQHVQQGTVLWKLTLVYGLSGVPGAVFGSRVLYLAGEEARGMFPFLMSGVLVIVSLLILLEDRLRALFSPQKLFHPAEIGWKGGLAILGFQLFVGMLMGLTSIGSGSLVILSLVYLFRMSAREIVGSNIVIALLMVIPASLTHFAVGGVRWTHLVLLLVGSLGGAVLGAKTTLVLPDRVLKVAMVMLIMTGAVATALKAW